jgi:hypothetical protein
VNEWRYSYKAIVEHGCRETINTRIQYSNICMM